MRITQINSTLASRSKDSILPASSESIRCASEKILPRPAKTGFRHYAPVLDPHPVKTQQVIPVILIALTDAERERSHVPKR